MENFVLDFQAFLTNNKNVIICTIKHNVKCNKCTM